MTSKIKGIVATVSVFAAFAVIYFSTLYRGFSPGASAHSVATALGLESGVTETTVRQIEQRGTGIRDFDFHAEPQNTGYRVVSGQFRTRHLVWRSLVAVLARRVPAGGLAFRLNAFSALLGALTVALAFALCRGAILFINFHDSPVTSGGRKNAAFGSALVAAVALGLSAPFWLASTRATPFIFDAFLMVAMGWLLFSTLITQRPRDLFVFGLLWGVSVFETDTGIFTATMLILLAIRTMMVGAVMNVRSWCNLLVGIIAGVVAYLVAATILLGNGAQTTLLPVRELFSSVGVGFSLARGGVFGNPAMLVSIFFVVLPFGAACALAMWRDAERNAAASGFLVFMLACTTAIALAKTPISPWGIYSLDPGAFLPVAVAVIAAATAGYLASFGAILAKGRLLPPPRPPRAVRRTQKPDEFSEDSVGRVIFWFTFALAVGCGLYNWREIRDDRDRIIETTAREFVSRLGARTWVASTTPALDTMLRICAWENGRPVHVIAHSVSDAETRRLEYAISRDEAFKNLDRKALKNALVSTNMDSFVTTWISLDPAGATSRLILDEPRLWVESGRTPVPAAIGYRALDKDEKPDWNAIAEDHVALWRAISEADTILGPAAPQRLRSARGEVRAYLCSIGESLAGQLGKVKDFPATRTREILDLVEDLRTEHASASRGEIFY